MTKFFRFTITGWLNGEFSKSTQDIDFPKDAAGRNVEPTNVEIDILYNFIRTSYIEAGFTDLTICHKIEYVLA